MVRTHRPIWALPILAMSSALLVSGFVRADDKPLRQIIDAEVRAAWKREKIAPAKPGTDAEFLRRVYLDLVGVDPHLRRDGRVPRQQGAGQARAADRSPARRSALCPAPGGRLGPGPLRPQSARLRHPQPRRLPGLAARADSRRTSPTTTGPASCSRPRATASITAPSTTRSIATPPEDATEAISQTFLGVQLQCARCHDHPFENWTQRDFYGMAAFLARLQVVQRRQEGQRLTMYAIGEKNTRRHAVHRPGQGRSSPGKKGEPVKPKFLLGEPLDEPALPADFKESQVRREQDAAQAGVLAQGPAGRLDHPAGQSLLRPGHRQPGLGAVPGPRAGPSRGQHEPRRTSPAHPGLARRS